MMASFDSRAVPDFAGAFSLAKVCSGRACIRVVVQVYRRPRVIMEY